MVINQKQSLLKCSTTSSRQILQRIFVKNGLNREKKEFLNNSFRKNETKVLGKKRANQANVNKANQNNNNKKLSYIINKVIKSIKIYHVQVTNKKRKVCKKEQRYVNTFEKTANPLVKQSRANASGGAEQPIKTR